MPFRSPSFRASTFRASPSTGPVQVDRAVEQDLRALNDVLGRFEGVTEAVGGLAVLLDAIRTGFGFEYGSAWTVDGTAGRLRYAAESGSFGAELASISPTFEMPQGTGLCGKAWQQRDVVYLPDTEGVVADCDRGRAALRAGARSALSFPIVVDGDVVACMDFYSYQLGPAHRSRELVLQSLARVVSSTFRRIAAADTLAETARDQAAVTSIVSQVAACADEETAIRVALDTVRREFDWAYGSFWAVDDSGDELRFSLESGSAGPEFRAVTLTASFRMGVGLSGRAWRSRDLVFVPDLGEISDCVRAPVAQRAGVRSGVCFPILVEDAVIGTMDFFTTSTIELNSSRGSRCATSAGWSPSAWKACVVPRRTPPPRVP